MKAFIVSSPYQILNSLQIYYPFDGEADMYVLEQFTNCSFLVDSLKRSGIFRQVVRVKNLTNVGRRRIKEFMDRNFFYTCKASEFVEDRVYDRVFFAAMDLTVYILLKYMKKQNPQISIEMIEDGLGNYIGDCYKFTSVTDTCFHKIFGGQVFLGESEVETIKKNLHLYAPQLVQNINMRDDVKKVVNNFIYSGFKERMNDIYCFKKEDIPESRVLAFDASTSNGSDKIFDEQITDAIHLFTHYFGEHEVGIKLHPRRKENIYTQGVNWGKGDIPAEVYFANMGDALSEKIVVSVISTSSVTPKVIFGKEPYIISLHRILQSCGGIANEVSVRYGKFLEQLKDLYEDKGKIFMPESRKELENIVRYLAAD